MNTYNEQTHNDGVVRACSPLLKETQAIAEILVNTSRTSNHTFHTNKSNTGALHSKMVVRRIDRNRCSGYLHESLYTKIAAIASK